MFASVSNCEFLFKKKKRASFSLEYVIFKDYGTRTNFVWISNYGVIKVKRSADRTGREESEEKCMKRAGEAGKHSVIVF